MVELGRDLSPDARWALVNVAGRMAEGATKTTAIRESRNGIDSREAKRRLELLREELRGTHRGTYQVSISSIPGTPDPHS